MLYYLKDEPRGVEFKNAMENYKRLGVNLTYQSLGFPVADADIKKWKESVKNLNLTDFDRVYTHNSEGEYHHEHHVAVNKIANELFPNTRIYPIVSYNYCQWL